MQAFDERAQAQRIGDDFAQILPGAHFAGTELEACLFQAHRDEI